MIKFWLKTPAVPIIIGLCLRLVHFKFILPSPVLKTLIIDSAYYHQQALRIAGGDIPGEHVFFMSPLYSYLLGLIYALFGIHPSFIIILQILLSSVTLWMIWRIAVDLSGQTGGLVAVWAGAIFPVWIYFDGVLLTASLILFLNTASLWALQKWFKNQHPGWLAAAGLAMGFSALARPSILLFTIALAVWLFSRKYHLAAILLLVWTLAPVSTSAVRNIVVAHEFALTTASGGMNFYVGNNPQATGLYVEPEFLKSAQPEYEFQDYIDEANNRTWKTLSPTQASRFWYKTGVLYLIQHPLRALQLWWNKLFYFCNNLEAPNNLSIFFVKDYSAIVRFIPIGFGMLNAFALVGLFFLPASSMKKLLLLYLFSMLAANMLYFTSSEFRFPALAVLLIGAGHGVMKIAGLIRERRWDWKVITIMVVMLLFTHWQTKETRKLSSPRMDYFNFGSVSLAEGKFGDAVRFFLKSLAEDPAFIEGHMGLGTALLEMGDYEGAAVEFNAAGYPVTPDFLKEQVQSKLNNQHLTPGTQHPD